MVENQKKKNVQIRCVIETPLNISEGLIVIHIYVSIANGTHIANSLALSVVLIQFCVVSVLGF